MAKYVLTTQADSDLESIFIYTAKEWGIYQAEKYLNELDGYMKKLAGGKISGKDCSKLIASGSGLYYYHANRHYIIYRKEKETTEIITLYHDRMDIERHLQKKLK